MYLNGRHFLTSLKLCTGYNINISSFSPVPMLNQLPPISQFSSEEQPDGETFQDWLEQFESVAELGGWSSHTKLVNLCYEVWLIHFTDLVLLSRGMTISCWLKRFTPIQIQSI